MCAVAVTSTVNVLVERLTNAISQTLCPSEIWFAKKLGNMVCLEQRNPDAEHEQQQHRCDHLSSPATAAGWRGGEGCSHPAAHQIGRSAISNSAGNSWDIFINVLKVFRRSVMQCCQWIAPPSWARLDCRHCTEWQSALASVFVLITTSIFFVFCKIIFLPHLDLHCTALSIIT